MRIFNVNVNGQPYRVEIEELASSDTAVAPAPAASAAPAPAKPAPAPAPAASAPAPAGTELKAPMSGTVLEFKVGPGDAVKKGQAVLILEAMKMENEIAAPADGAITFTVAKGASVETGHVLAVIA